MSTLDLFPSALSTAVCQMADAIGMVANRATTIGSLIGLLATLEDARRAARAGDRIAARGMLVEANAIIGSPVAASAIVKATMPVASNESLAAMRLAVVRPDTFEGDTMPSSMVPPEVGYASEAFCQFLRHRGRSAAVAAAVHGAFTEAAMRAEAASTGSWLSFWLAADGQLVAVHGFDGVEAHKRAGHRLLGQFAAYFLPGSDGPVFKAACWAGNNPVFQPVGMLWRRLCQAYAYGTGLVVTTSPVV